MHGFVVVVAVVTAGAEPSGYLGPSALVASKQGDTLFVANADACQVAFVEIPSGRIVESVDVPAKPAGLALSPDGQRLYVTCAAPQSTVAVIDTERRSITAEIAAGHTAVGPSVSPDGKRLYVCNRFDHDVSMIDLATGGQIARVPVTREPVASAVTPDGKSLVVANHLPAGRSDTFYVVAAVTVVDTDSLRTKEIYLPNGSTGVRGLCLLSDGRYALVTHILANYEL
ncbi:MAG: cytochrome D1 domain-containing protein, partial [Planctomycetota bacterium]